MSEIYLNDFRGDGKLEECKLDKNIYTLSYKIKNSSGKRMIIKLNPSDSPDYNHIELFVNKTGYRIFPSKIGKFTDNGLMKSYGDKWYPDLYELYFSKKSVYLYKNNTCIDEIKSVSYPVNVDIKGGTMIMERLDVQ